MMDNTFFGVLFRDNWVEGAFMQLRATIGVCLNSCKHGRGCGRARFDKSPYCDIIRIVEEQVNWMISAAQSCD